MGSLTATVAGVDLIQPLSPHESVSTYWVSNVGCTSRTWLCAQTRACHVTEFQFSGTAAMTKST